MKKKTLTSLTLVALTGMTLVGCGKNENTVTDDSMSTDHSNETNTTEEKKAKTAEKIVKQYAEAIFAGNYDEALSMIDMPEGSIKDASAYENYLLKSDLAPADIKSIETTEMSSGEERQVDVSIETKDGDYIETTFYACLTDDNKWMISPKELVVENWKVVVPSGATVKLNGEELSVKPEQEEMPISLEYKKSVDTYKIPMIISSNYRLEVSHPLAETVVEEKVFPGSGKSVVLEVSEESSKKIQQSLTNMFEIIIAHAEEEKDFGELLDTVFSSDSNSLALSQQYYNHCKTMLSGVYKHSLGYYEFKDTTVSDVKIEEALSSGNDTIYVKGSFKSVFNERYSMDEKLVKDRTFSVSTAEKTFEAILKVTEDGEFLVVDATEEFFDYID